MSVHEELLAVQEHDTAADRLRHRRRTLPELTTLAGVEQSLARLEPLLADAAARQNEARRTQQHREDELTSVESRIADLEARMYSGTVTIPRELQAMQADVDALRRRRSHLEEHVLEAMTASEAIDEEVAQLERERSELDDLGSQLRGKIAEAETAIEGELAAELQARETAAASLPPDLMRLYEQLRAQLDGIAAARLANGRCGGCHLTLPATELDRIRREPPDVLVRCEQCGRLLVR